jgi:hypothetical protein
MPLYAMAMHVEFHWEISFIPEDVGSDPAQLSQGKHVWEHVKDQAKV